MISRKFQPNGKGGAPTKMDDSSQQTVKNTRFCGDRFAKTSLSKTVHVASMYRQVPVKAIDTMIFPNNNASTNLIKHNLSICKQTI